MVFFFILGTIIGSFLNVVILRYGSGSKLSGRSHCFSCSKDIAWYDLVPLFSFINLKGHCRHCKSRISFQYPLVELCTGLIFAAAFWRAYVYATPLQPLFSVFYLPDYIQAGLIFSISLIILSLLVIITVYDIKHKIIPDLFVFLFGALSLAKLFLTTEFSSLLNFPQILNLLAGPILALPLFLLWFFSRGRWIGLGDAKLALGIGWFLGFPLGVSSLILGFWIGAVISLSLLALSRLAHTRFARQALFGLGLKNITMRSEVPLAPFLILGLMVVYFFGIDVTGLSILITM